MKTTCNRLAMAFTLAMLAIPLLSFALERDSTFYVQYCRAWTSTPTRNDGCIVNTDIQLTSNSVVEIELEVTDVTATTYIFSAGTLYQLASTGTQWQFHYGGNNAAHTAKGGEIVANKRYVVRTSPEGIFVDGTLVAARTLESFTPTSPLTLFSQATSNWNRGHLRFFWMKIYEPDDNGDLQLEHELRPCMIVGAKMGIYDEIGGVVFAPGNHEWQWRGVDRDAYSERAMEMCRSTYPCDLSISSRVVNGVNFVAMDDSVADVAGRPGISEEQVGAFAREVEKGLPIVLCLHVPFFTPEVWRTYCQYWRNRECRFADAFPAEPRQMNGITEDFVAYLKTEPLLKAILAGHQHYSLDERFSPTAMQYLVAGNFAGAVRHLLIT